MHLASLSTKIVKQQKPSSFSDVWVIKSMETEPNRQLANINCLSASEGFATGIFAKLTNEIPSTCFCVLHAIFILILNYVNNDYLLYISSIKRVCIIGREGFGVVGEKLRITRLTVSTNVDFPISKGELSNTKDF